MCRTNWLVLPISIRAPAWGATIGSIFVSKFSYISIRAPAWGATKGFDGVDVEKLFQSALPRGERP